MAYDKPKSSILNIIPLEKRLMLDASLPVIADQVLWLDAADDSTIFDADGDDAASGTGGNNDGFSGTVATWQDKSGNNNHQSSAASEAPSYSLNARNNLNTVYFDGINDDLNGTAAVNGSEVTIFAVYRMEAGATVDGDIIDLGVNSPQRTTLRILDGGNPTAITVGGGLGTDLNDYTGSYAEDTYYVNTLVHNGANFTGYVDGVQELTATAGTRQSTTSVVVGNDSTSGNWFEGDIAEIIVYERALTADERHDVETYLAGKWNISITNTAPTLDTNNAITVNEASVTTINNTDLASSDVDNSDGNLIYRITDAVDNGTLTNTNAASTLGIGDSFTQSDLDNGYITYTHDGGTDTADAFTFTLTDNDANVTGQTFSITVTAAATSIDIDAIPNPVLHFDSTDIDNDGDTSDQPGDGVAVSAVEDGAGGNNDATQGNGGNQPLYDENAFGYATGGLVFDGGNDEYALPTTNEVNNQTFTEKSFAMTFRTSGDVVSDQVIYEQGGGTHGFNFGIFGGNIYAHQYRSGAAISYAIDLGPAQANTTYQVIAIFDSTANTWSANVNGAAFVVQATAGTMPGHSGGPGLGADNGDTRDPITKNNVNNRFFEGSIGELWSWNHALDAGETATVQDYFNDKWFDTAHSINSNNILSVQENAVVTITEAFLETQDLEAPDDIITYTVTGLASQGIILNNGTALGLNDTFTQQDINNGLVQFDHDGTAAPTSDSFTFTVSDGFNTAIAGTFNFDVVAAGNDPIVVQNSSVTLNEGASVNITSSDLDTDDANDPDTAIVYTITTDATTGTIYRSGVALGIGDTFTQDDINNTLISYTHNDGEVFADSFVFSVSDGSVDITNQLFAININPINDQSPTDITLTSTSINENVADGTVVGILNGTDGDLPGDTFTFTIQADPDNRFDIVGNELRKQGGSLNFENQASHSVTIRISDGSNFYDEVFTINVNDLNENPTDLDIDNTTINENVAIGTLVGTLSTTDPDLPGDTFTYSITANPDDKFEIVGDELRVNGTLDFEASASHSVTIRVDDGNGGSRTETYTINLVDVNDTPIISVNPSDPLIGQGSELTLTLAHLSATDQDSADNSLIYEVTSLPANGEIRLSGVALLAGQTFTQQNIIDGDVSYISNSGSIPGTDSFDFTVTDGGTTTAAETVEIRVTPRQTSADPITLNEGDTTQVTNADLNYQTDSADWYDTNWQYRQRITIDSSLISSDLTDYTMLLTGNGFTADFWNNVKADGTDIVVTAADGTTKLDRELVSLNTGAQTMQLYTRTDLSSVTDTEIYIYYGNAAAAETNDATTWDSNFTGVWHFDDDFSDGNAADSSQAGHDGQAGNGFGAGNQTNGIVGNAAQFNNNEYLALDYEYSGNNTLPQISVSAWINTTDNSGGQADNWAIIDFDRSDFFNVFVHGDGTVGFSTAGNGFGVNDQVSSGLTVNDGNWHKITAVYDGTDKILYVDGVEVDRETNVHGGAALGQNNRYGFIGDGSEATAFDGTRNNAYYDGLYDEIRVYEGAFSDAWVAADFANQNDPSSFYFVGVQENSSISPTYTLTSIPANGTLFLDTVTANGTLDAGEALAVSGTFTQDDIDSGRLYYVHDGGETIADSIAFTVADNAGNTTATQGFNFVITPVNDAPDIIGRTLISNEDFEGGAIGWNDNTTEDSGAFTEHLGRFSQDGGVQTNFKTYALSTDQDFTIIEFDFYRIDSWDNETFNLYINDVQIFAESFNANPKTITSGTTGIVSYSATELALVDADYVYATNFDDQAFRYTLIIENAGATDVKLGFGSTLNEGVTNEAWGVDNVNIYEAEAGTTPGPFSIAENSSNGTVVTTIRSADAENDNVTYTITGGTGASAFDIDLNSGDITVSDSSLLDFETTPSFTLQITATDDGTPNLTDVETITINLIDLEENTAPTIDPAGPFSIAEDTANGTTFATLNANDAEGDNISWAITNGNTDNIFAINNSGEIRVNDNTRLNFEGDNSYTLTIRARDNGFGSLESTRNITINITDVNEAPSFDAIAHVLAQNSNYRYSADTGNFYQYVDNNTSYTNASTDAASRDIFGVAGHLVTITSAAENTFVDNLIDERIWLAASDAAVEGEWRWLEGPEAGQLFWLKSTDTVQNGLYENWNGSEPNNASRDRAEMRTNGRWYDMTDGGNRRYVVEWEGADVLAAAGALQNGPYTLNEDAIVTAPSGAAEAFDVDAGDTITYSITGGTGVGIFAIDPNSGAITVADNSTINHEVTTSYTLDILVTDIAGLTASRTITINIADVNDSPDTLTIDNTDVDENTANGFVIGNLGATDEDLPADILTFSIVSDPDSKFQVVGNQLQVNGVLDFEAAQTHDVTIRVSDGNGGFLDRILTINLTDIQDAPPPTDDSDPGSSSTNSNEANERIRDNKLTNGANLLSAGINGSQALFDAFYGVEETSQILRTNISDIMGAGDQILLGDIRNIRVDADGVILEDEAKNVQDDLQEQDEKQPIRSLKDAIEYFENEQLKTKQAIGGISGEGSNIATERALNPLEQEFEDILNYHQKRQDDLRKALMDA